MVWHGDGRHVGQHVGLLLSVGGSHCVVCTGRLLSIVDDGDMGIMYGRNDADHREVEK